MGFMTGRKIYENFQNGQGPEGLTEGAGIVNELAAEYEEVGDAIRQLTAKMDGVWQGDAAGAAQRGAGPLAVEHELAGPHLNTAQDLTGRQAGSFADARNAVVPVPPEPTRPDPWAVFKSPGQVVTFQQQVAKYNAANQHNVDVMTGYAGASSFNAKGMPQSYGSLSSDQAGIAIDTGTSDPGGPRDGGPKPDDSGRGIAEWSDDSSRWVAPPSNTGGPAGPEAGPGPGAVTNRRRRPRRVGLRRRRPGRGRWCREVWVAAWGRARHPVPQAPGGRRDRGSFRSAVNVDRVVDLVGAA